MINPRVELLVQIVVKVQEVNLIGLSIVIRDRGVALRGLFWEAFFSEKSVVEKGNALENEVKSRESERE